MAVDSLPRARKQFAVATGFLAVVVGFLVLVGWVTDTAALKSVVSGLATMKPNAALSFVLVAVALWATVRGRGHGRAGVVGAACASAVG